MSGRLKNEFRPIFTKEDYNQLIKCRIIQKNLVHFQNFPDSIADQNLLIQSSYFGQFGQIKKIVLVSKKDENSKKTNNAYITFSSNEEAAYAILVMDSLIIDNHLVRAFFGTSKYCIHFLNNIECFNKEKCMYIHSLANENEILGLNSKFSYNDHLKLAKKIIGYGSFENRNFILNLNIPFNTIFPNIKSIYLKDELNENNTTNSSVGNNSSISWSSKSSDSNKNIFYIYNNNNYENYIFKYKGQSRFFCKHGNYFVYNDNDNDNDNDNSYCLKNLIDDICIRLVFFKKFDSYIPFEKALIEFSKKKYGLENEFWIDYGNNNIEQGI